MNHSTLQLNLAQLTRCIQKTKINKYSDLRKEEYHKSLMELFAKISTENFVNLKPIELESKRRLIEFIFSSIQYLDNSTLSVSPFEITYCLETALSEWINDKKFIVVSSLSNKIDDFSFNPFLALNNEIYQLIAVEYGINFNHRLIQITLPRYSMHDYLTNVLLYHELGHFIDANYKISQSIINQKINQNLLPHPKDGIDSINNNDKELKHNMEYFADIFAAQYIGDAYCNILGYIAYNHPTSHSHPSIKDRLEKLRKFIKIDNSDARIQEIIFFTKGLAFKDLKNRLVSIPLDDFYNLIPPVINNDSELHSILNAGWRFWQENPKLKFANFDNDIIYKITNNLIEKSISNYKVTKEWKNVSK